MIRTLLLAAFALPITASVLAQEFSTTFIPYDKDPSHGTSKVVHKVLPPMATDAYAVAWDYTGATEKKALYSALVMDRATGKEVNRGTIPMPHEDCNIMIEDILTMGKDLCILYRAHHKKEWHVTLFALRLSLPDLKPVGEAIKVAYYDFPGNGNPFFQDYGYHIEPSPDGSKWGILLYQRFKSKKEQEFACYMVDAQFAPLWEHIYKLPTEAERLATRSITVTNAGEVYVAYAASENKGAWETGFWTVPDLRYPSFVGKVDASGSTVQPLDVGEGRHMTVPNLIAVKDGFLVGGIISDRTPGKSKVQKVGTLLIGADLAVRSGPELVSIPGVKPEEVRFVDLFTNGTTTWMFVKSEELLTCLVGEGASIQKVGGKIPFADLHGTFTISKARSEPVAALFDLTKNFEAMRTGEGVRSGVSYNMEPGIIHWDATGKAKVKIAITEQDGVRDGLKVAPHIGRQWVSEGLLVDQLTYKAPGIVLIELK